ncbi:twin-arginine translocase subunit TatB [Pelagibius litoralis]|uniref:Sec-independent protein translocase protein TatB n=1 Tax=Pelagibius litoralis TaxID=374515 RepID=A0A967C6M2_9PROT|nr:Sec-independent protein translocase protein TatB [Pelagibius litoralis]NIA67542.1 twin-arginine translocase subunit TatB [Pelagibius litoralis]
MFDIGWTEMMVIALIALVVIGPKDLPGTLKTVSQWVRKARSLTREFQSGIDDMVREAELDDAKKMLEATRRGNLEQTIGNAIDPTGDLAEEVRQIESEARKEEPSGSVADAAPEDTVEDSNTEKAAALMTKPAANIAPPHSLGPTAGAADSSLSADTSPKPTPDTKPDTKEGSKQSA